MEGRRASLESQEKEFEAILDEKGFLQGMRILQAAFSLGIVSFAVVIGYLHWTGKANEGQRLDPSVLSILAAVHAVVAVISWVVGLSLPSLVLRFRPSRSWRAAGPGDAGEPASVARRILELIRKLFIARLALLEGPALFGLVVCMVASLDGALRERPLLWLNGLSAVLFLGFALASFPTRDRLTEWFREIWPEFQ